MGATKTLFAILLLSAGLLAQNKPEFSIQVAANESVVKVGSAVVLAVKKTNLRKRVLPLGNGLNPPGAEYTYDVRRDGVLVAETKFAKKQKEPPPCKKNGTCLESGSYIDASVQPHQTITEEIPVSDYRDMRQPGKYTIQLQQSYSFSPRHQGNVKSNVVTVTVEP